MWQIDSNKNTSSKKFLAWDAWTITSLILVIIGFGAILFPWNVLDGKELYPGYKLRTSEYSDLASFITGVSTPLLGLATIIMLIRTYALQKQQLQEANEGMAEQMGLLQKQRFDDNFFRLLENHHRIVEAMDLHGKGKVKVIAVKRDCFRTFYNHMKVEVKKVRDAKELLGKKITIQDINRIYDATQEYYKADLHHYFRFIYHILKFVKNSKEITDEEKYKYTSILRATLSPYELTLIFYNCLHEFGDSHFKPLVEEFSFLKNRHRKLLFIQSQQKKYHRVAFARSENRPAYLKEWQEEKAERERKEREEKENIPPIQNAGV